MTFAATRSSEPQAASTTAYTRPPSLGTAPTPAAYTNRVAAPNLSEGHPPPLSRQIPHSPQSAPQPPQPAQRTLFVLGATHHRTPIEVREKLALPPDSLAALHAELNQIEGLEEFAPLSTCNRTEFYGVASRPEALAQLQRAFCTRQQFAETQFAPYAIQLQGPQVLQHLFEVATGLDSQLVGETEIFGQLKDAYAAAQARHSTGPILNRLFQKAFQAAKYVRTHTAITEGQVSVANVAVELARDIFGPLGSTRVLLLGAGEIGEKTARAFQSRGTTALSVASRRLDRAMALASELGAFALPFWLAPTKLAQFDIVVCATAAPASVIAADMIDTAMHRRAARPLLLLDLALPRLYNLDDLARIAEENRNAREAEITHCRELLHTRATSLWATLHPRLTTRPTSD